jgi:hypothetical protein
MSEPGLYGIINNASNRFLQAKSNGETHCSQTGCFKEESWIVVEVNKASNEYALLNWNNKRYLSKFTNGAPCATAKGDQVTITETWIVMSGAPYGLPDCIGLRSAYDRTVLGANDPDDDSSCGGEVLSRDVVDPINHSDWPGWWRFVVAQDPPQDDPNGTVTGVITGALGAIGKGVGDVVTGALFG